MFKSTQWWLIFMKLNIPMYIASLPLLIFHAYLKQMIRRGFYMFIKWRCTCIPLSFTRNSYGNACIVIFYLIALSTATEKNTFLSDIKNRKKQIYVKTRSRNLTLREWIYTISFLYSWKKKKVSTYTCNLYFQVTWRMIAIKNYV